MQGLFSLKRFKKSCYGAGLAALGASLMACSSAPKPLELEEPPAPQSHGYPVPNPLAERAEHPLLQGHPDLQAAHAAQKRASDQARLAHADYGLETPPAASVAPASQNAQRPPTRRATPPILVRASYPQSYTVSRGDTLWDISARFLKQPWRWPEIWKGNPNIQNPHLIYPGDRISLRYVDGMPGLYLDRDGVDSAEGLRVVKLSPRVRYQPRSHVIPMLRSDALAQYIEQPRVVSEAQIRDTGYVLGNHQNRLISATNQTIYALNLPSDHSRYFNIYRPASRLKHPGDGRDLGVELRYLAQARLEEPGSPATLHITDAKFEVLKGDLLLPASELKTLENLVPRRLDSQVDGQIVSLFNAISQAIRHQIVTTDLGRDAGVRPGDMLNIHRAGKITRDPRREGKDSFTQLPEIVTGSAMVLEVFDNVSHALIVDATDTIRVGDRLSSY